MKSSRRCPVQRAGGGCCSGALGPQTSTQPPLPAQPFTAEQMHSNATPPPPHPWPCVTFTLRVVVSTSQPGVVVMTAYRALIRPSGEDAMGRSCILDSPPGPGRGMPAAVRMPAVVRMPACHSRRFKGERPIGAATEPTTKALFQPPPSPQTGQARPEPNADTATATGPY